MRLMMRRSIYGFTLIEVSIVAVIMGVLTYALYMFLNPADLQRRARDEKRFRDLQSLDSIFNQHVAAGGESICVQGCNSVGAEGKTDPCGENNWLQTDLCDYASSIPLDPANGVEREIVYLDKEEVVSDKANLGYYCRMRGGEWHCMVYQESKRYAERTQDSNCGCYKRFMEIRSGPILYGEHIDDLPCDEVNAKGELCVQGGKWF